MKSGALMGSRDVERMGVADHDGLSDGEESQQEDAGQSHLMAAIIVN